LSAVSRALRSTCRDRSRGWSSGCRAAGEEPPGPVDDRIGAGQDAGQPTGELRRSSLWGSPSFQSPRGDQVNTDVEHVDLDPPLCRARSRSKPARCGNAGRTRSWRRIRACRSRTPLGAGKNPWRTSRVRVRSHEADSSVKRLGERRGGILHPPGRPGVPQSMSPSLHRTVARQPAAADRQERHDHRKERGSDRGILRSGSAAPARRPSPLPRAVGHQEKGQGSGRTPPQRERSPAPTQAVASRTIGIRSWAGPPLSPKPDRRSRLPQENDTERLVKQGAASPRSAPACRCHEPRNLGHHWNSRPRPGLPNAAR